MKILLWIVYKQCCQLLVEQVDATCGRLWVLDCGNNDANEGPSSRLVCPPKLMIYDLLDDNRLICES